MTGASPNGDRAVVNGAEQVVSAVPASVPSATGWLIEGSHIFLHIPHWWHPTKGWLPDANEALRFAREIDAAEFAKSMIYGAGGTATEHVFVDGERA